jgi:hypothetical protein
MMPLMLWLSAWPMSMGWRGANDPSLYRLGLAQTLSLFYFSYFNSDISRLSSYSFSLLDIDQSAEEIDLSISDWLSPDKR